MSYLGFSVVAHHPLFSVASLAMGHWGTCPSLILQCYLLPTLQKMARIHRWDQHGLFRDFYASRLRSMICGVVTDLSFMKGPHTGWKAGAASVKDRQSISCIQSAAVQSKFLVIQTAFMKTFSGWEGVAHAISSPDSCALLDQNPGNAIVSLPSNLPSFQFSIFHS